LSSRIPLYALTAVDAESAIANAVNGGGDADTIGAVAELIASGQL